ncbi:MAG: gamma-glutamylcyclotransferase [Sandaracinus sp.]|nr:gamma-glutamylcyclotransferase [Sandaracinus sp.]MCB9614245.1 gamma-glutamylcyclotransferase [Sandaracinus sp.]MCB9625143.1 gamma-glutamylcyclotransferase [Sandaracinus sp.]
MSVWYFAYGANMATDVLVKRRGLRVLESRTGCALGVRMGFVERGLPLVEPAFAGLVPEGACDDLTTEAWGVLHRLPAEDVRTLDGFEGSNYVRQRVEVRDLEGAVHQADAYTSPRWARGHRPSRRYRDLLVRGACMHGLPEVHVAWLLAHPTAYVPLLSEAFASTIGLVDRIARVLR